MRIRTKYFKKSKCHKCAYRVRGVGCESYKDNSNFTPANKGQERVENKEKVRAILFGCPESKKGLCYKEEICDDCHTQEILKWYVEELLLVKGECEKIVEGLRLSIKPIGMMSDFDVSRIDDYNALARVHNKNVTAALDKIRAL